MIIAALLLASGCAKTTREQATGKGSIRGINAIVTSPELVFLIEERPIGNVNYKGIAGFAEWDDLRFNFNFDIILPGASQAQRIATEFLDVTADTEYTLVLTGTIDNPSILMWNEPERVFDGTETVFEADFANLSPQLGQVDIYFATEGTAPVLGNEIGTLDNGDRLPHREFPAGDYELIVTAPGDPATVLFHSNSRSLPAADRVTVALFDPDPTITAGIGASIIFPSGSSVRLDDINSPPQIRMLHAAFGTANFDGFFNNDFGTVVFPDTGFGELSAYADLTEQQTPLTLTPVGDIGTTIFTTDIQLLSNSRRTVALWGAPASLASLELNQDARPVSTFPLVRITNFSSNSSALDIYEVDPDTVLDDTVVARFGGAPPGISTNFFNTGTGMREFLITNNGDKTPISAPLDLDLANGDVIDAVILDTADPATVELRVIDSIP